MMKVAIVVSLLSVSACVAEAKPPASPMPQAVSAGAPVDVTVKDIDGKDVALSSYRGKVILIANVASECGYTPQYADLQKLHALYEGKGFSVLGFPSNDFGGQEPDNEAAIKKFAQTEYGVTFPLFAKVHATGPSIAPLYKTLTEATSTPGPVKWNFAKFLIGKDGRVIARFDSNVVPTSEAVTKAIDAALKTP
jgi:glutathione peroxidase